MKCIDKIIKLFCCVACISLLITGCTSVSDGKTSVGEYLSYIFGNEPSLITEYEKEHYNKKLYEDQFFAADLCVGDSDIERPDYVNSGSIASSALFSLTEKKVDYASGMHERVYPASTTKILTALTALNNGNPEDMVTVGANGAAASFASDEQVCGLKEGDQVSFKSLLAGLLLHSGNDSAVALAEHIAGSEEAFVKLMNEQAAKVMATNSHFVTASGLHDENHYTTAYDLYLIFNECLKNETFTEIIRLPSYSADITSADGTSGVQIWYPTNYYAKGEATLPETATVIGGKTGYTGEAGNCLVLWEEDNNGNPYISIVMGAETKPLLYEDMTSLINTISNTE